VAHLCEGDRDRAHPWTADAHDMKTVGDREVERGVWSGRRRNRPTRQAGNAGVDAGVEMGVEAGGER
jgi:hypothetical protein